MKKILFMLMLAGSCVSFAQKMPSDYFEEADQFLQDKKLDEALKGYEHIVEHNPKNELYPKALYNAGYIHFLKKDYEKALAVFTTVLNSNFNEKDHAGGGIMDDPFANYRHRASEIISTIYYDKKEYDTSLHYLILSDEVYPYLHFCGNEYASYDIQLALRYAAVYQKLCQPQQAIEKLLPAVFITLVDNAEVLEALKTLLTDKKDLKQELDRSLDNIYSKKIKRNGRSFKRYYFKFLNVELRVPYGYEDGGKKFNKKKSIIEVKQTDFYRVIEAIQ